MHWIPDPDSQHRLEIRPEECEIRLDASGGKLTVVSVLVTQVEDKALAGKLGGERWKFTCKRGVPVYNTKYSKIGLRLASRTSN
jgi:hypothetical protein